MRLLSENQRTRKNKPRLSNISPVLVSTPVWGYTEPYLFESQRSFKILEQFDQSVVEWRKRASLPFWMWLHNWIGPSLISAHKENKFKLHVGSLFLQYHRHSGNSQSSVSDGFLSVQKSGMAWMKFPLTNYKQDSPRASQRLFKEFKSSSSALQGDMSLTKCPWKPVQVNKISIAWM